MKIHITYAGRVLLFSMLFQSISMPYGYAHSDSSYAKDVMGFVGVLGAAVSVYGLGYCCGWWGSESNEQLIESATKELQYVECYRPMMTIVNVAGALFDPKHNFDEALLYQLAFAKRGSVSIDSFSLSLESAVHGMRSLVNRIDQRSMNIKQKGDWQEIRTVGYRLDDLSSQLHTVLNELERLVLCLEKHNSYFKLFEYEDYVRNRYINELQFLDRYSDTYAFREAVRACAINKYSGPFALIEFVQQLNHDIKFLEDLVARSAYNYATRISYAREVVARLYHIERLTVSDNEYMRTLLEYQRDQREKEHLKLEHDRLRIEQCKTRLKERELMVHERQVSAQETSNMLKAVELADKYWHQ